MKAGAIQFRGAAILIWSSFIPLANKQAAAQWLSAN
jgi:hypothetical protein